MLKRKIIFVISVFVLFLTPFIILSNHFLNMVDEVSVNDMLNLMETNTSRISSAITDELMEKYDILKGARERNFNLDDLKKYLKEIKKNKAIIKDIFIFDFKKKKLFSLNNTKLDNYEYKDLLELVEKSDIPIGRVVYPKDLPPQLILAEKYNKYIVVSVEDLGYINDKLYRYSKKIFGELYLIDADGRIIFDSNYDYVFNVGLKINPEIIKLINSLISKNIFTYRNTVNLKDKKLISITNVETTKWWLVYTVDYERIVDWGLRKWASRVIISGILLFLIFSIITLKLYELIVKSGEE